MTVTMGDNITMTERSNKYSFAAGVLLLITCLSFAYDWLIEPLRAIAYNYTDKNFFEYMKYSLTEGQYSRGEKAEAVLVVTLVLLTIAVFRQNIKLFLAGMVLDLGLLVNEYLLFRERGVYPEFWTSYRTLGFVTTYVVPALMILLFLAMGVTLILNKAFAKWICIAIIAVATFGALLETVLCVGPYLSTAETWRNMNLPYTFYSGRYNSFYLTSGYTPASYFVRAGIGVLIALWGLDRCKAKAQK